MSAVIDNVPVLRGRYACVDLETTGADLQSARIIEVGIVLIDDGVITERWNSLVDPERSIPERIQAFTGISDEMVRRAPTFVQLLDEISMRCADRIFAAHNARFDFGFLQAEFARAGRFFRTPLLCTVKLSRRLDRQAPRHNLDAVIERYGLQCEVRHRALPDAQAVADFLIGAAAFHGSVRLQDEIERQLRPLQLPPQLSPTVLDELPDAPGAFRFVDGSSTTLRIGRAGSIRTGVAAQLDKLSDVMREQVANVEWQRTAGEWSARLIETLWRASRSRERYTLHLRDRNGGPAVRRLTAECLDDCYGEFRTAGLAERILKHLAREHRLCLRVLGLEEGSGSCVAYQLGRCRGACVGEEPRALHDVRVQMAFAGQGFELTLHALQQGRVRARPLGYTS